MNISSEKSVVKTYNKFSKLPLGSITARGWLKEQLLRNKDGMGGHLDELEPEMIATPFINYTSFKRLPNETTDADPTFAAGWSGEISGTYWAGLTQMAFTLGDQELIDKVTTWVDGVLKHQEPDGYLGSYSPVTNRLADYNPWSANWCYRALLSFYEATGRKDVLNAVYRGLLWFCENWKDHKTDYAAGTIMESMIITYAYTGDQRLVSFCEDFFAWLEIHSPWQNKISQYLSDKFPFASMHAVAYGEAVKHPAVVYCATGEKRLLQASVNGMKKALRHIVQTTGGASSCNEYLSPKGAVNETEYCNFSTFNHSYSWLALTTGEAHWGDEMERCLFNGAEGARKKDERAIAYFTAPNQLRAARNSGMFTPLSDMTVYAPCYFVACCPTQSIRTIPEFIRSMGLIDDNKDLYLLCYGPAEVKAPKIDFTMDTLYPFRDTITLHVTRAENAVLNIRIPAWCKAASVTVNGKVTGLVNAENGYARIDSAIAAGDTIVIRFPMEITITKVDDSDSASKFPISIERGPLVYALPVPEKWTEYPGSPITPLPEGWSWYEAMPDLGSPEPENRYVAYNQAPWARAIDENLTPDQIRVIEHDTDGYVWENPPITLEVPLYHVNNAYVYHAPKTYEFWRSPLEIDGEPTMNTLVPHGCTNLRITYLPRAAKSLT
ncbi:MAG: hypothetical protein E7487_04685 [Ruminococcaceae bacterium]|nr:hypothetical protein [Oscillospiraceae bacterium]